MIRRHFVDVRDAQGGTARVHYRRAGEGPPLLLVHQSPRSSEEYLPLIDRWSRHFTCIAPDTRGFGQSDPLPMERPDCADYARATLAFLDAIGLQQTAAYGFHSGAIILVTAAKLAPERFTGLACGGYAVWTEAEKAEFGAHYTPPFHPSAQGEHLAWLWGRLLEQGWFFPWYRTEPGARLPAPHADPARIHPAVMDCLSAGNSFATGYAAVLQANRDVPEPGQPTPPVLIAAYDGDPLKAHLARLGSLPPNWRAEGVATPADLGAAALAFLVQHPAPPAPPPAEAADAGFVRVGSHAFDGMVHWCGRGDTLWLHAPGGSVDAAPDGMLAIDLPGHGLSDPWVGVDGLAAWADAVVAAVASIGAAPAAVAGDGWSALLARVVAERLGVMWRETPLPPGDAADWRAHGLPDLEPDADGLYLIRAWRCVRATTCFQPWFRPAPDTAVDFDPADLAPARLAVRHLALLRATGGPDLLAACLDAAGAYR